MRRIIKQTRENRRFIVNQPMEITPDEFEKAVSNTLGYILPDGSINILVIILVVAASIRLLRLDNLLLMLFRGIRDILRHYSYNQDVKDFIKIRTLFVKHSVYEIERLNREADWNDFHYTDLEAEVEVDPALDILEVNSNRLLSLIRILFLTIKSFFISPSGHSEKNLVRAILRSKSRAFLIIGDPGAGKTVSLRHLFLKMAEKTTRSKNESAQIPLYLNLKQLDIPIEEISANAIEQWVIKQILAGQNRTIHGFVNENFDKILQTGDFFFIFDSFDEIPAIMDAYQDEEVALCATISETTV